MNTIRIYPNEEFREIEVDKSLKLRYAISNKARLISFKDDMKTGRLLKGGMVDGYKTFGYKISQEGKRVNKRFFIFKLVAEYFITKTSEDQTYVLHLDYNRDNDDVRNLKWATREEMIAHGKKSPHVIQAKKNLIEHNRKSDGTKLTITKVILIKKMLQNPDRKTRLKMIAKQFGVSETQIIRIQKGENWGYIKV
ncbi:hypothetical protein [Flavobacterium sp.]|uniref:hypothetical protein n=1 Tax=Flavobacterium sp. TaxID=239 RepID=UPI002B4B6D50|nr:hypothetical protein [Flavobacterium sp.]HLF52736.1 hypothetical protein [Flavobacterium sp.]